MAVSVSAFDNNAFESIAARILKIAFVLGMHVALAGWVLHAPLDTSSEPVPVRMDVRMINMPVQKQQEIPKLIPQQPKPLPQVAARSVIPRATPVAPPDVPVAAPAAQQMPTSVAVAPQQPAPVKEEAPPAPAPVVAARFDADYLQNPAPVFPPLSRKLREEGKVHLLVQVSAKGEAENVQLKQSSGFLRLDEAAMNAVRKWRFIPARRGTEAVASSVVVPLVFRLDS